MKKISFLVVFQVLFGFATARESVLETYIREGLEGNLALNQAKADYNKSLQALRSARGLFFPDLGIDARYTKARGGRVIEFPAGDMLNPVYYTLNQLTQTSYFPQIDNVSFEFYRPTEQETKLSLVQPLFNPKILYNYQMEKTRVDIEKVDVVIYSRELIMEIKTAYFNYLKTNSILQLLNDTEILLQENLRVSGSLFENDKVTRDVIFRAEAELQKLVQQQAEAEKANKTARAYFNFLLNRPLETPVIAIQSEKILPFSPLLPLDEEIDKSKDLREELIKIKSYKILNDKYINIIRSTNYPTISFVANYGFQGENYSFTRDDDFMLASIVLRWNLFHGFRNRADLQAAKIDRHSLELKTEEAERQIELQVINAYYELIAAYKAVVASEAQALASEKAFRVVEEKYRNGQAQLIEYTDARTTMTNSQQSRVIALYDFKISEAEYERVTAGYILQ